MNKKPHILFRGSLAEDGEEQVARKIFGDRFHTSRSTIPSDSVVIGRYSVLPYYKELREDLQYKNSTLINSLEQHVWIASFSYYHDIAHLTFPSWHMRDYPYCNYDGPVVLKGTTNSMKMKWNTHMYAANRQEATQVSMRLYENDMLSHQGLVVRQYIPLATVCDNAIGGLPITKEYRLFFYKNKFLAGGFYFANLAPLRVVEANKEIPRYAMECGQAVADIACDHANFFVVDVAQKVDGGWICVEINDGQMSGLSNTDPCMLYNVLQEIEL